MLFMEKPWAFGTPRECHIPIWLIDWSVYNLRLRIYSKGPGPLSLPTTGLMYIELNIYKAKKKYGQNIKQCD